MKCCFASLAFALLALAQVGSAQSGDAGAKVAPTKVGVVSLQQAVSSIAEGKKAAADLEAQFAPRQAELQDLQKQIDDIRAKLAAGQTSLSQTNRRRFRLTKPASPASCSEKIRKHRKISMMRSKISLTV